MNSKLISFVVLLVIASLATIQTTDLNYEDTLYNVKDNIQLNFNYIVGRDDRLSLNVYAPENTRIRLRIPSLNFANVYASTFNTIITLDIWKTPSIIPIFYELLDTKETVDLIISGRTFNSWKTPTENWLTDLNVNLAIDKDGDVSSFKFDPLYINDSSEWTSSLSSYSVRILSKSLNSFNIKRNIYGILYAEKTQLKYYSSSQEFSTLPTFDLKIDEFGFYEDVVVIAKARYSGQSYLYRTPKGFAHCNALKNGNVHSPKYTLTASDISQFSFNFCYYFDNSLETSFRFYTNFIGNNIHFDQGNINFFYRYIGDDNDDGNTITTDETSISLSKNKDYPIVFIKVTLSDFNLETFNNFSFYAVSLGDQPTFYNIDFTKEETYYVVSHRELVIYTGEAESKISDINVDYLSYDSNLQILSTDADIKSVNLYYSDDKEVEQVLSNGIKAGNPFNLDLPVYEIAEKKFFIRIEADYTAKGIIRVALNPKVAEVIYNRTLYKLFSYDNEVQISYLAHLYAVDECKTIPLSINHDLTKTIGHIFSSYEETKDDYNFTKSDDGISFHSRSLNYLNPNFKDRLLIKTQRSPKANNFQLTVSLPEVSIISDYVEDRAAANSFTPKIYKIQLQSLPSDLVIYYPEDTSLLIVVSNNYPVIHSEDYEKFGVYYYKGSDFTQIVNLKSFASLNGDLYITVFNDDEELEPKFYLGLDGKIESTSLEGITIVSLQNNSTFEYAIESGESQLFIFNILNTNENSQVILFVDDQDQNDIILKYQVNEDKFTIDSIDQYPFIEYKQNTPIEVPKLQYLKVLVVNPKIALALGTLVVSSYLGNQEKSALKFNESRSFSLAVGATTEITFDAFNASKISFTNLIGEVKVVDSNNKIIDSKVAVDKGTTVFKVSNPSKSEVKFAVTSEEKFSYGQTLTAGNSVKVDSQSTFVLAKFSTNESKRLYFANSKLGEYIKFNYYYVPLDNIDEKSKTVYIDDLQSNSLSISAKTYEFDLPVTDKELYVLIVISYTNGVEPIIITSYEEKLIAPKRGELVKLSFANSKKHVILLEESTKEDTQIIINFYKSFDANTCLFSSKIARNGIVRTSDRLFAKHHLNLNNPVKYRYVEVFCSTISKDFLFLYTYASTFNGDDYLSSLVYEKSINDEAINVTFTVTPRMDYSTIDQSIVEYYGFVRKSDGSFGEDNIDIAYMIQNKSNDNKLSTNLFEVTNPVDSGTYYTNILIFDKNYDVYFNYPTIKLSSVQNLVLRIQDSVEVNYKIANKLTVLVGTQQVRPESRLVFNLYVERGYDVLVTSDPSYAARTYGNGFISLDIPNNGQKQYKFLLEVQNSDVEIDAVFSAYFTYTVISGQKLNEFNVQHSFDAKGNFALIYSNPEAKGKLQYTNYYFTKEFPLQGDGSISDLVFKISKKQKFSFYSNNVQVYKAQTDVPQIPINYYLVVVKHESGVFFKSILGSNIDNHKLAQLDQVSNFKVYNKTRYAKLYIPNGVTQIWLSIFMNFDASTYETDLQLDSKSFVQISYQGLGQSQSIYIYNAESNIVPINIKSGVDRVLLLELNLIELTPQNSDTYRFIFSSNFDNNVFSYPLALETDLTPFYRPYNELIYYVNANENSHSTTSITVNNISGILNRQFNIKSLSNIESITLNIIRANGTVETPLTLANKLGSNALSYKFIYENPEDSYTFVIVSDSSNQLRQSIVRVSIDSSIHFANYFTSKNSLGLITSAIQYSTETQVIFDYNLEYDQQDLIPKIINSGNITLSSNVDFSRTKAYFLNGSRKITEGLTFEDNRVNFINKSEITQLVIEAYLSKGSDDYLISSFPSEKNPTTVEEIKEVQILEFLA